ncbi:MAG: imidazoleglycerol-phosphate dehydratase [Deltaproteobacteria bacterium]|jgi:imidazoleglycerol-phosphate dehydratase|nr:imidazoleglycerol-phosphate dehydratase [Deltaproteobacteria bacterium]
METPSPLEARVERQTLETNISCFLSLDRPGVAVSAPSGFFTHMLTALATYAGWGLDLRVEGDSQVDFHHGVEDAGLVLGDALREIGSRLPERARFASALVPMDDSLAEVALDAGQRPYLHFEATFPQPTAGHFDFCLVEEFFRALVSRSLWTLHVTGRRGRNSHHLSEAIFKAVGLAARAALAPRREGLLSTKGSL